MTTFGAGPGKMPEAPKQAIASRVLDSTCSLLELSDRSAEGRRLLTDIRQLAVALLRVPHDFTLLVVPGGGTLQFAMTAYSLRPLTASIAFVETDHWTVRAREEMAQFLATASIIVDAPSVGLDICQSEHKAIFFTSNNTATGTQWSALPALPGTAIRVVDMSSDLFLRTPDYERSDLILACAQKNFGVAGLSIVIVRNSVLETMTPDGYLSYRSWHHSDCLHSTFPMVPAAVTYECLRHMERTGLGVIRSTAKACSEHLYRFLDQSDIFYGIAPVQCRSEHNVTFDLKPPLQHRRNDVIARFETHGLSGLKGHPSVGGFRASFYFGAATADAAALVDCLAEVESDLLQ